MAPKESKLNANATPFIPLSRKYPQPVPPGAEPPGTVPLEPVPPHLQGFEQPPNPSAGPSGNVMADLLFLEQYYPIFAKECVAEVYLLNEGNLEDSIDMLEHLEEYSTDPSASTDVVADDSESEYAGQSSLKTEDSPGTEEGSKSS